MVIADPLQAQDRQLVALIAPIVHEYAQASITTCQVGALFSARPSG
jgi:hypothetical protein